MSTEKDQSPRLGHDPLEWLEDDESLAEEAAQTEPESIDSNDELAMPAAAPAVEENRLTEEELELELDGEGYGFFDDEDDQAAISSMHETAALEENRFSDEELEHKLDGDGYGFFDDEDEQILSEPMSQESVGQLPEQIELPESLLVQDVDQLHANWSGYFVSSPPEQLKLDASQLAQVDAAGVQLLYALVHQLSMKGCSIRIHNVQPQFDHSLHLAGLTDLFKPFIHV